MFELPTNQEATRLEDWSCNTEVDHGSCWAGDSGTRVTYRPHQIADGPRMLRSRRRHHASLVAWPAHAEPQTTTSRHRTAYNTIGGSALHG